MATNCLLIVYEVSLALSFESVSKVLTTGLGSLYIATFFSGDINTASLIGSIPNSVVPSSSNKILSFAFARLASVAFNCNKSVSLLFVNSISAVKSVSYTHLTLPTINWV